MPGYSSDNPCTRFRVVAQTIMLKAACHECQFCTFDEVFVCFEVKNCNEQVCRVRKWLFLTVAVGFWATNLIYLQESEWWRFGRLARVQRNVPRISNASTSGEGGCETQRKTSRFLASSTARAYFIVDENGQIIGRSVECLDMSIIETIFHVHFTS